MSSSIPGGPTPEQIEATKRLFAALNETPLIEMSEVAELMGWTTQRARRTMKKWGRSRKLGGRWVTTPDELTDFLGDFGTDLRLRRARRAA
jgi:hypothetical protein